MDAGRPLLSGRRVNLVPVKPEDYQAIYELETSATNLAQWRYGGRTPSPEEVFRSLWDGVLAQFAVRSASKDRFLGYVNIHDADLMNGTAKLAGIATQETRGTGLLVDGFAILLNYAFRTFPIRKIYAEVNEFNLDQIASSVGTLLLEEGRLVDHVYSSERYWDRYILAISRDHWKASCAEITRFALGDDPAPQP